ncbi:MAG TPA: polyphosphate kinase 2 [Desulfobulbus sp.]|nr:polyphosphate kinase 2 [Desulfobulbus sp.]
MKKKEYRQTLYELQVQLVKFQKHVIENNLQVCVLFEGRDTAGKDGTIKRFIEHLSPREARNVALGKPSDSDKISWYFQRYVPHLPKGREIVFFNRSWYNRAGVERVMQFCSKEEYRMFITEVASFEQMLTHSGILFFKYYLDISRKEQKNRLQARKDAPLKQWKLSPIDAQAQKYWQAYSKARDTMFEKTSYAFAPWYVIHTDDKKTARINAIKHFLAHVDYPGKKDKLLIHDRKVICTVDPICYTKGMIAP